jgi:hypothetical protein
LSATNIHAVAVVDVGSKTLADVVADAVAAEETIAAVAAVAEQTEEITVVITAVETATPVAAITEVVVIMAEDRKVAADSLRNVTSLPVYLLLSLQVKRYF